jgi:cupin fold WbuC family metalloprotein
MLIVEQKGMNIPPHSHHGKSDFIFVVSGTIEYFEFPNGPNNSIRTLLEPGYGFKSPPDMIHGIGIASERCAYLETCDGPFDPQYDAVYPAWARSWHLNY